MAKNKDLQTTMLRIVVLFLAIFLDFSLECLILPQKRTLSFKRINVRSIAQTSLGLTKDFCPTKIFSGEYE